jgi:hypothetical protein
VGQAKNLGMIEQAAKPGTGQLDPYRCPESEAGHRQARNRPFLIREPLHAHRNGHHVGHADPGAAHDPDKYKLCPEGTSEKAPEDEAQPKQKPAKDRHQSGPGPDLPAAG